MSPSSICITKSSLPFRLNTRKVDFFDRWFVGPRNRAPNAETYKPHVRHRVAWTDRSVPTFWLTIHYQ
jgi:hypothetical protein